MKKRRYSGFTLAELLAVVAILIILFAVVAVNVAAHQRSMTRLEFDAIAKEIFFAAQNHLTVAESQGYPGLTETAIDPSSPAETDFGMPETEDFNPDKVVYYFDSASSAKIRELMLPPYAVDAPGSFIIRYQAHPARVLDVFYSQEGRKGLLGASGKTLDADDADEYATLMDECRDVGADGNPVDHTTNREHYPPTDGPSVVGWYGGGVDVSQGEQLAVPTFEIHNEEQLYVKVFDPNRTVKNKLGDPLSYSLKLVVVGKSSGAERYFSLWKNGAKGDDALEPRWGMIKDDDPNQYEFSILLDDITGDGPHFAEMKSDRPTIESFIPGEDLEIYVVAYSAQELANIAKSGSQDTNSLFADPAPYTAGETVTGTDVRDGTTDKVAGVANFRHLENLDGLISGLDKGTMPISMAGQTSDMDWAAKWTDWKGEEASWTSRKIQPLDEDSDPTDTGCYYPVSPDYVLNYKGNPPKQAAGSDDPAAAPDYRGHVIKNVKVDFDNDAGLFGSMLSGSAVSDLELVDFEVTASSASGNAGALIGTANKVAVENVLARNTCDSSVEGPNNKDPRSENITAQNGSAGGLIGSMNGGSVEYCAAALYVRTDGGTSGGLIGEAVNGAEVKYSYAGGHTEKDPNAPGQKPSVYLKTANGPARLNVIGGTSGGLIGAMTDSSADTCYSTCSVSGTVAGGLIGSAAGTVKNSYAAGLVETDEAGIAHALIGTVPDGKTISGDDNRYLWIINQDQKWQKQIMSEYDTPAAAVDAVAGIEDAEDVTVSTAAYTGFLKGSDSAKPYNTVLSASYGGLYPMLSVKDLGGAAGLSDYSVLYYVSAHYGDWPMPETLAINN